MRLNREVGDAWMVAISHNNLGNALRGLGDYAARGSTTPTACASIATATTAGRSPSCSRTSAVLAALIGRARARRSSCSAPPTRCARRSARRARRRARGGDRRGDRAGRSALPEEARDAARARGRGLDRNRAIDAALAISDGA